MFLPRHLPRPPKPIPPTLSLLITLHLRFSPLEHVWNRFLQLVRPIMCVVPEVSAPDRKVNAVSERVVLCEYFGYAGPSSR